MTQSVAGRLDAWLLCVTVLWLSRGISSQSTSCDVEGINTCFLPASEFMENFEGTIRTREELDHQCRLLTAAANCARPLLASCHVLDEAEIEGRMRAHEYVCSHQEVYLAHQACLTNSTLQERIGQCVWELHHYQQAQSTEELCSKVDHDLSCVRTLVATICPSNNDEASQLQYQIELLTLQPVLLLIDCDVTATTPPPTEQPVPGRACDVMAINKCLLGVQDFMNNLGVVYQSERQVQQSCRQLISTMDCALPLLSKCHVIDEAYVMGHLQAMQYLCSMSNVFLKHQTCLINEDLATAIGNCMYTVEYYNTGMDPAVICSQVDHNLECVGSHVSQQCKSAEAADFRYQFEVFLVKPVLDLILCDMDSHVIKSTISPQAYEKDDSNTGVVAGVTVVCVLVVLVAAAVAGLYMYKRGVPSFIFRRTPHSRYTNDPTSTSTSSGRGEGMENPVYGVSALGGGGMDPIAVQMEPPAYDTPAADGADNNNHQKSSPSVC